MMTGLTSPLKSVTSEPSNYTFHRYCFKRIWRLEANLGSSPGWSEMFLNTWIAICETSTDACMPTTMDDHS